MNNWPREIRHALRADPILAALVGQDAAGEVKVYTPLAKSGTKGPYVTFAMGPGGPIGTYGDLESIEPFRVIFGSWCEGQREAWQLADAVDDAIQRADYSFEPYYIIYIKRATTPEEYVDRDLGLNWTRVEYDFALGR